MPPTSYCATVASNVACTPTIHNSYDVLASVYVDTLYRNMIQNGSPDMIAVAPRIERTMHSASYLEYTRATETASHIPPTTNCATIASNDAFAPAMAERKSGHVVVVTSLAGIAGFPAQKTSCLRRDGGR